MAPGDYSGGIDTRYLGGYSKDAWLASLQRTTRRARGFRVEGSARRCLGTFKLLTCNFDHVGGHTELSVWF